MCQAFERRNAADGDKDLDEFFRRDYDDYQKQLMGKTYVFLERATMEEGPPAGYYNCCNPRRVKGEAGMSSDDRDRERGIPLLPWSPSSTAR